MSKTKIIVRPINERTFAQIPIDKIVVVNSRDRDEERFQRTVRSISEVGQQKPICVNERNFKKTGKYELVCGEGRLKACRQLGWTHIEAEIVDIEEGQALLAGLAENLTRQKKNPIEIAKSILFMHKKGLSKAEIARATDRSKTTIDQYITLMEKGEGEERLISGVETGRFSISLALLVLENSESDVRQFLMDEFDHGRISTRDVECINKILDEREKKGLSNKGMSRNKFTGIIGEKTKDCNRIIAEVKVKQDDAIFLANSLNTLWKDEKFVEMIANIEGLSKPELKGRYGH